MKLLIAEDDKSVCEMLQLFFQNEDFQVTFIHDGLAVRKHLNQQEWDLIILDWMLPFVDGITLCKEIRASMQTPVILLTARSEEKDRVMGLELGADDYVTKPFSPIELLARIKAVSRRYTHAGNKQESVSAAIKETIEHDRIYIDLASRKVSINDRTIDNLTKKEFDLFCLFVNHPKRVFTREQLLEKVWGYDYFGEERTVDVHIKRLRNKVSTPERPLVYTVWGIGYKLEES
nr:response regulator transcription factor [Paenibacillus sp. GP183]